MTMIFLSHTYADKPVVEPIAIRLREIFGQEQVFYDAWSIQPGDGIIDRMNHGLSAPDIVFFFVSAASLGSKMVDLEWQNALYKQTKGQTRIVPIRVDSSSMPPLLMQNLYLDMFTNGLEAVLQQIVNICQGNNTFTPQHLGFSNLTAEFTGDAQNWDLVIRASHFMEPDQMMVVCSMNPLSEWSVTLADGGICRGGENPDIRLDNGLIVQGHAICPLGNALSPGNPMRLKVQSNGPPLQIVGVMHRKSENSAKMLPLKQTG